MRILPIGSYDHGFYYQRNIQPVRKLSAAEQAELEAAWLKIKPTCTAAQFGEWRSLHSKKFAALEDMKFPQMIETINRRFDSMFIYRSNAKNALYA